MRLIYTKSQFSVNFVFLITLINFDFKAYSGIIMKHIKETLARLAKARSSNRQEITLAITMLNSASRNGQLSDWLNDNQTDAKSIAYILFNCGQLARSSNETLQANTTNEILSALLGFTNLSGRVISIALTGLGRIAEAHRLQGAPDAHLLNKLLEQLVACQAVKAQEISNTLYGLGRLVTNNCWGRNLLTNSDLSRTVDVLLNSFYQKTDAKYGDKIQSLLALTALHESGVFSVESSVHFTAFIKACTCGYLHPNQAIQVLECLVALKAQGQAIDTSFQQVVNTLMLPLRGFSPASQARLETLIENLSDKPQWQNALQRQLGLSVPHPAPEETQTPSRPNGLIPRRPNSRLFVDTSHTNALWDEALQNDIFKAIAKENLKKLAYLLGVRIPTPIHRATTTSRREGASSFFSGQRASQQPDVRIDEKRAADSMTERFLQHTNIDALKQLISTSDHRYFELLLRACSHHQRYQFAIQRALHPILLHLPKNQLARMTEDFIALEFYRDHQALLSLVEALNLRGMRSESERLTIQSLQERLITRAIDFHSSMNNHHVVSRLKLEYENLQNADFILRDDEVCSEASNQDEISVASTPRFNATYSVGGLFTQTSATQAGTRPAPASLALPDGRANVDAWYTSEDINRCLNLRLGRLNRRDLRVLPPLDFHQTTSDNVIRETLANFIGNPETPLPEHYELVLPLNIDQHWVAVRISIQAGGTPHVTYYDSLYTNARNHHVMHQVNRAVYELYEDEPVAHGDATTSLQQGDGTSCGAFLVENVYADLQRNASWGGAGRSRLERARMIRTFHLELLQKAYPDNYPQPHESGNKRAREEEEMQERSNRHNKRPRL